MKLRLWDGSRIVADLDVSHTGVSFVTNPSMPNNDHEPPNMELDPFHRTIKLKGKDVIILDEIDELRERADRAYFGDDDG